MTGKKSIFKFLRMVVAGTLAGGLLFGAAGFLLSGMAGFVNMVTLGLAIGLFGTLILRFAMLVQSYGLDTFGKTKIKGLGYGWFVKTSDNNQKSVKNEK